MNSVNLELCGILQLEPAPYMNERGKYLTETFWRVTRFSEGVYTLDSLSGTLAIVLHIDKNSIVRFDPRDFGFQRDIQQGVLRLRAPWRIPPEGTPAFEDLP